MLEPIEHSPLYRIANPESIVFFGASNRYSTMGSIQLDCLISLGFEGPIYPVHPKEEEIQGLKAYKSVLDLPDVPDLAVIVLPTKTVPQVLEECGRKGVKHAVIVSGGFKEIGKQGEELQNTLIDIAHAYGMRFLGPNCIGIVNPHHKLNTTFFEYKALPGFIGMASQSGSFITQMFDYLSQFGLGFSTGISVGNEANIDIVDCMEYLATCPHTKVIGLYIEAVRRGRDFLKAARSIVAHKPIVAFYVGGSEAGRRASLSHTAALAGPDELYEGAFRQAGIIRAHSIQELFDFCWALGLCPFPEGPQTAVQTHSGGPGAAAADACSRRDLKLPPLSSETLKRLKSLVPQTGSLSNPVDLTFARDPLSYFSDIPKALLEDKDIHNLLVYFLVPRRMVHRTMESMGIPAEQIPDQAEELIQQQCKAVAALVEEFGKPIIGFSFRKRDDTFIRGLQDRGIPVFPGPERAAKALSALVRYAGIRKNLCSLKPD